MFHRNVRLRDCLRSTLCRALIAQVMLAACAAAAAEAVSGGDPPLTMGEAETRALDGEPGREALLAGAEALREQAVAAGQLPDPQLSVGLANYPIESGGFRSEAMTQGQLGLRQAFPPGATRAISTRRFTAMADAVSGNAEARRRDVLTAVRSAWLETRYWQEADATVRARRPYFSDLVSVTRSLYAVGQKDQQDVLRAELELSRLDDRLIDIAGERERARAALSEWVGDAAYRPMAPPAASYDALPPPARLRAALAEHPEIGAAKARLAARSAEVELAEERFKPGWAVNLSYGYRDGLMPDGAPRSDFVSVAVTVDLPMFRRNRQDRSLRAALGERRAAGALLEAARRRLASRFEAEYAQWRQLGRRIDLYETTILIQAEDRARAALAAYRSDTGDFAEVMRGRIDELGARLELIRLQFEQGQSHARLANLGGLPR